MSWYTSWLQGIRGPFRINPAEIATAGDNRPGLATLVRLVRNLGTAVNTVFPGSYVQFPQVTTAQRDAIANPTPGAVVFNTDEQRAQIYVEGGWTDLGAVPFNLTALGSLNAQATPVTGLAPTIIGRRGLLVRFLGRRGTPGSAGTTSVQLELNGTPIPGAVLSWTSADAANAFKGVTGLAVDIVEGDLLSFRITSSEGGAAANLYLLAT